MPGTSTMAGIRAAHRRAVRRSVTLVVRGIVGAIRLVDLAQPGLDVGELGGRRQVEDHRPDLGPEEMVGTGRAQRGEPRMLGAADEVEDDIAVGVVPHLRPVGRREAADEREESRRPGVPVGRASGSKPSIGRRTDPGGRCRR